MFKVVCYTLDNNRYVTRDDGALRGKLFGNPGAALHDLANVVAPGLHFAECIHVDTGASVWRLSVGGES